MSTSIDRTQLETDVDLWSEEVLLNPFPYYKSMRDIGPAAYLTKYNYWILTRYGQVQRALRDWETFSSAHLGGVAFNPICNEAWAGGTIILDPPEHGVVRKYFNDALSPRNTRNTLGDMRARSDTVVTQLLERSTFDGVIDFAQDLPLHIVMDLVGWPHQHRDQMLAWAECTFNAAGPENQRTIDSFPRIQQAYQYLQELAIEENMLPGSFGAKIFDAVHRRELPAERVPTMLAAYLSAALDTTINAVGSLLWLFATHPDQWKLVHEDPSLVPGAFLEGLRLESPVQFFSRATTRDVEVGDGVVIPADSKVIPSYGAANRDERRYPDPDRFDVRRNPTDVLAFGTGVHACPGRALATMEAQSLFSELAKRVRSIELVGEPQREANNISRGLISLPIRIS